MKRWESCNFALRILKAILGTSAARPQAKSSNTNRKPFASARCNRAILPGQMDIMLSPVPENWLHFPIGVPMPSKSVSLKGGNLKTMVVCWKGCAHLIDYNSLPCLLEFPSQLPLQKSINGKHLICSFGRLDYWSLPVHDTAKEALMKLGHFHWQPWDVHLSGECLVSSHLPQTSRCTAKTVIMTSAESASRKNAAWSAEIHVGS